MTAVNDHPITCWSCHIYTQQDNVLAKMMNETYVSPYNLTMTGDGSRLYVVGQESNEVVVVDPLAGKVLEKINNKSKEASAFLANSSYLFITFGTARIYRFKETGLIVSNCHKLPASMFESELLTVNEIVKLWADQIEKLNSLLPDLKIVFTISPVRHWKDGAHGNQVSKAVLFLSIEELLKQFPDCQYFPAYELVMDDLRDYRFYDDDMLHPSAMAINYIWGAFCKCYIDNRTRNIWNEVVKITKACRHRVNTDSGSGIKIFAEKMLSQISDIEANG